MVCVEVVRARGHPNILATHKTTFEITTEKELTLRGDCIIAVEADKSASSLSESFKECLKSENSIVIIVLEASGVKDVVLAQGSPSLLITDPKRIIIRKSTYVEPATLAIRANKAARDLNRDLIRALKNPETALIVYLYVFRLDEITSKYPSSRSILQD